MISKFPYEKRSDRLLSRRAFTRRLALNGMVAFVVIVVALAIGMAGYMALGDLGFVDSFLNAAMILSGMGPVASLEGHDGAKIFAGLYAIFSGLLIFAVAGIILAPVFHRLLHSFHLQDSDRKS
jgi:hypothetical protein